MRTWQRRETPINEQRDAERRKGAERRRDKVKNVSQSTKNNRKRAKVTERHKEYDETITQTACFTHNTTKNSDAGNDTGKPVHAHSQSVDSETCDSHPQNTLNSTVFTLTFHTKPDIPQNPSNTHKTRTNRHTTTERQRDGTKNTNKNTPKKTKVCAQCDTCRKLPEFPDQTPKPKKGLQTPLRCNSKNPTF